MKMKICKNFLLFTFLSGFLLSAVLGTHLMMQVASSESVVPPYTYYLAITSTAGGTTNPLPGTHNYSAGSWINVTAIPNTGYSFDKWLFDAQRKTENPITIIMDANHTLRAFFVDSAPPTIAIISPENKTYTVNNVSLTFNVNESTSRIGYSLDGKANVTIAGNTTLTGLSDGSHNIVVYADDTVGNTGTSGKVYFRIEAQAELFLIWVAASAVIITGIGIALLVYFVKVRKKG